jgi:hypothetical protein
MGGMSCILTGDTKKEVREKAKRWYQKVFDQWEMYPRLDVTNSKKKDFLKKGFEELVLVGDIDNPLIFIQPMKKLVGVFFYKWLKPDDQAKKFGCVVSVHS